MKYVQVYKLDNNLKDNFIGRIFIEDGAVKCRPSDNVNLVALVNRKVRRWPFEEMHFHDRRLMVDKSEPEVFLNSLHANHQSGYMRVGPVKEEEDNV